jgi:hypothetical protein
MSRKAALRRHAKRELTPLEQAFVLEYLKDFVGGHALARAGSTAKYLDQQASEMLRKPIVADAIARAMTKRNEALEVNAKWVLTELVVQYRAAAVGAGTGKSTNSAERANALRALDKIGQHVDVSAFRAQIGLGNPDGTNFDFSGLDDDELSKLESILSKAAISGGDSGREESTRH